MESSTLVWILNESPDDEQVWFPGVVQSKTDLDNGETHPSSTQTAACRERTCTTTTWTAATNHVSPSGHLARVCHEV